MKHTRASVIARVEREFAELDAVVSALRPADWKKAVPRPETKDPWTVKDSIVHIVHWKEHTARGMRRERRPQDERGREVNDVNAMVYQRWRDRPASEVVAYHRKVHDDVMRTLRELPAAFFSRRERGDYWPGDLDGHSRTHRLRDIEIAVADEDGLLLVLEGRPSLRFHRRLARPRKKVEDALTRAGLAASGAQVGLRPDGNSASVLSVTVPLADAAAAARERDAWRVKLDALELAASGAP